MLITEILYKEALFTHQSIAFIISLSYAALSASKTLIATILAPLAIPFIVPEAAIIPAT